MKIQINCIDKTVGTNLSWKDEYTIEKDRYIIEIENDCKYPTIGFRQIDSTDTTEYYINDIESIKLLK